MKQGGKSALLTNSITVYPLFLEDSRMNDCNSNNSIPFIEEWLLFQNEGKLSDSIREEIKQCWLEAQNIGLNGFETPQTIFLNDEQFQSACERSSHLIRIVNYKVEQLFKQLADTMYYPIYLFNQEGILLEKYGENHPQRFFELINIQPSLMADFPFFGYSALSLTLKTNKVQVMIGAEHTCAALHSFSTIAVPIFHPINRECIGVLNLAIDNHASIQSYLAFLISLGMAVEENIRMEYSHANIFKIHEETTNLIDHYVSIISSDGRVVDCNNALREFLAPDPLIGKMAVDVIAKNFDHNYKKFPLYRAIFYAEEALNYEVWTKVRGKKYCFLCDTKIIYDPFDTELYWIIFIFKDITQKKEMELTVLQREKLVSLGTLAAGLAHEIRNPLTTAKGFIQFLSESSTEKEAFTLVQNELNRITQLVNQFVLLSKPDSPQIKPISIYSMLEEFSTFIQPEALLKGIEVYTLLCSTEAYILGDKSQLIQVFINLAQNAFAAIQGIGSLTIKCKDNDSDFVQIQFIDDGTGVEADHLDKILDPFFTTREEGTGLGLPICFQIIEAHHGELRIDSELGVGTIVTIFLPREQRSEVRG